MSSERNVLILARSQGTNGDPYYICITKESAESTCNHPRLWFGRLGSMRLVEIQRFDWLRRESWLCYTDNANYSYGGGSELRAIPDNPTSNDIRYDVLSIDRYTVKETDGELSIAKHAA